MANFAFLSWSWTGSVRRVHLSFFHWKERMQPKNKSWQLSCRAENHNNETKDAKTADLSKNSVGFFTMLSISLHKRGQPQLETDIITPPATLFCREMSTKLSWLMALLIQHAFWFAASVFYCSTNRSESDLNDIGPLCRCHYRGGADCEIVILLGVDAPLV